MRSNKVVTRRTPEHRRAQILDAGAALFAVHGFEGLDLDAVAARIGVSRALVYHYFAGRDPLVAAVVTREFDLLLDKTRPDPTLSAADQLEAVLEAYLSFARERPAGYRSVLRAAGHPYASLAGTIVERNFNVQVERVVDALRASQRDHARVVVKGWLSMLTTLTLQWLEDGTPTPTPRAVAVATLRAALAVSRDSHCDDPRGVRGDGRPAG